MLRFLHLLLTFSILASSLGVSVTEHLCGRDGRSAAVFGLFASGCCGGKTACTPKKSLAKNDGKTTLKRKPCCENKTKYTQNVLKTTKYEQKSTLKYKNPLACAKLPTAFFAAPSSIHCVFKSKTLRFRLYKPPPLCRDIPVLIQSFLC
jgi:hypothetical protein